MKKCKSCQSDIDEKAKKCPKCQADQRNWFVKHKIITAILIIILISIASSNGNKDVKKSFDQGKQDALQQQTSDVSPSIENNTTIAPTKMIKSNDDTKKSPTAVVENKSSDTLSQKNAVRKAKSYLDYSGFSRSGLIKQLEYEKFSHEDAVYGADNIGADWNKQAERKAKSYMDYSAFSRGSLITQLEYEGFTNEQAVYGANAIGL